MFENRAQQPQPDHSTLPAKGEAAQHFAARAKVVQTGANAGLERVLAERPDLIGQPCLMPQAGLSALTFLFTDEVVKMPRLPSQQDDFTREHRILSHLHAAGLPVPAVTAVGSDDAFYCQQRLSGTHFDVDALQEGTPAYDRAAQQIVDFMLAAQNAVSAQAAARIGLTVGTPDVALMDKLLDHQDYQRLLRESDENIVDALRDYVASRVGATPVFAHADIQPANLLCDRATGEISTVIDFGLCHYGDPAVAFHALYRYFPHGFVDKVAGMYADATGTEPVTLQQATTARLAHEMMACAKNLDTTGELCHGHRNWLRDIIVEFDNSVSGYVPPKFHFMGIV